MFMSVKVQILIYFDIDELLNDFHFVLSFANNLICFPTKVKAKLFGPFPERPIKTFERIPANQKFCYTTNLKFRKKAKNLKFEGNYLFGPVHSNAPN